jgi:NitT/TauT family transport system substrate-binding protein
MTHITTPTTTAGHRLSRRQFLKAAGGLGLSAAAITLLEACGSQSAMPSPGADTLETTTIRLADAPAICLAPQYLAEGFLRSDGFTDVQYIKDALGPIKSVAAGQVDLSMTFGGPLIIQLDAGDPIVILGGVHVGCFELFGTNQVQAIGDLKGKTVAVAQLGSSQHVFLASMLAYVGLDPTKDVNWVTHPSGQSIQLLAEGKIDAYMAFPPEPQELRAKTIGHVVVNSMMDKPWSQYFCCMVAANREFVQKNPVATKRALRAFLRATDVVALHPEQAAQLMVDKGFTPNYDYALQAMKDIPYNRWRVYNPEDTIRFYSLLLHGIGMIKSTPEDLIKKGTDWRFLNELKAEMPATPAPAGALAATRNLLCQVDSSRITGGGRTRATE